jgi:hypothetical protein
MLKNGRCPRRKSLKFVIVTLTPWVDFINQFWTKFMAKTFKQFKFNLAIVPFKFWCYKRHQLRPLGTEK